MLVVTPRMGMTLGGGLANSLQVNYGETVKAMGGWDLVLPTSVYINGGGSILVDGIICPEEAEYGCTVHRDADDSGPLRGDGGEVWGLGC